MSSTSSRRRSPRTLDAEPVLVRQRNITGATFHPELTSSLQVHSEVFGLNRGRFS